MMPETLLHWLSAYGYLAIFLLLAGGVVGIPIPDELLLAFAGYLVSKGNLLGFATIMAAFFGSICGITITYSLGRTAGSYIIKKWGHIIRISEERLTRAGSTINRKGKPVMFFSYFLPGLRQATPFTAGLTGIRFPVFAACAYTGGLVWSASFVVVGYCAGKQWLSTSEKIHQSLFIGSGVLALILVIYFYYLQRKHTRGRV